MNNNLITHEEAARNFQKQIQFTLDNYKSHELNFANYANIVICGLGGSGIGGKLAMSFFKGVSSLPIEVISGYDLPLYVNEKTLVIVSSYSGNTEETISLLDQAIKAKAKCLAMSTGGEIEKISTENNIYFLHIKPGYQPRMALGFSFSYLLLILSELFQLEIKTTLQKIVRKIEVNKLNYEEKGKDILTFFSSQLNNKFVIISGEALSSVALRACQQIQENAKHEIFHHTLPECNHNAIESYYNSLPSNFIFLEGMNHERTNHRFTFLSTLLEGNNCKVYKLALSENNLYGILELILILDWLSIHLSNENQVNNMEVPNIMRLKKFLADIK
jgi:glucose/mannose-6-phosphate isomerase